MFDVSTPGEDSLQIDPTSLHIDPDIKQGIDPVQLVLPGHRIILKLLDTEKSHIQYAFIHTCTLYNNKTCLHYKQYVWSFYFTSLYFKTTLIIRPPILV